MAVYTVLEQHEIEGLLEQYDLGTLESYSAIEGGIENTNYFLELADASGKTTRYVLTLFENLDSSELPFFMGLTQFLEGKGFPVPNPKMMLDGRQLFEIRAKKGVIVPCLPGKAIDKPSSTECEELGELLAEMHVSLSTFEGERVQTRSREWKRKMQEEMHAHLPEKLGSELELFLDRFDQYASKIEACQQGLVHGDLFVDNVLFSASKIGGVIDFYHACRDALIFDIAVAVNDWCWNGNEYDEEKLNAFLGAYREVRPWTPQEQVAWPFAQELAALRFYISRLHSRYVAGYQQESLSGDQTKDPEGMANILRYLSQAH